MSIRYEVSVWNIVEGDHVKKLWEATEKELDDLREWYDDDPFYQVVVDREWEVEDDDDE